jgi:metal-sulfur cluster biosynthetic enzyme
MGPPSALERVLWERLETVIDPCMQLSGRNISVVDLGLINAVVVENREALVSVTMTDAFCANAHRVFLAIEALARVIPGLDAITVVPRSFPLWTEDRMSERGRAAYRPSDVHLNVTPNPTS